MILSAELCHSLLAESHGVFLPLPNNLLPPLLNYRYTLITSLGGKQILWKSWYDPPPHFLSHTHTDTNTPTQILIFTANLHPFHNLSQLFLIPCRTDALSGCQSSSWLQKHITNVFLFPLQRVASMLQPLQSSSSYTSSISTFCDFTADQSFTSNWFFPKAFCPSPNLDFLHQYAAAFSVFFVQGSYLPRNVYRIFSPHDEYFPQGLYTITSSSSSSLSSTSRHHLASFHCTFCQKHLYLLPSILLLCFDILISAHAFLPSGTFLCESHLGI